MPKNKGQHKSEVDERGVRYDAPFYPHPMTCFRGGMIMTNPQPCVCGGNDMMDALNKKN